MRIVVDLEAVQVCRHVGTNTAELLLDLAQDLGLIASEQGEPDVVVLLNDAWFDTVLPLRAELKRRLPRAQVVVWSPQPRTQAGTVTAVEPGPDWVSDIRALVIASLRPQVVLSGAPEAAAQIGANGRVGLVLDSPPRLMLLDAARQEPDEVIDLALDRTQPGWAADVNDRLRRWLTDRKTAPALPQTRPRLAYVSPLPPVPSGIATYARDLLPELSRWYEIDVVTDQPTVTDSLVADHATITDADVFLQRSDRYQRVLYQFGNSGHHKYMFPLLERVPGVVMLHDFFLGHALAECGQERFVRGLRESHGAHAARDAAVEGIETAMMRYPANLEVLQQARGVIVHSAASVRLAEAWYGASAASSWAVIPHLRAARSVNTATRQAARAALGLPPDAIVVCSFGLIGRSKLCDRILEAFARSGLAREPRAVLVFVGRNDTGRYGRELLAAISAAGLDRRVHITGWADDDLYERYLQAADMAVQLRSRSRGETSGAVIDCMAHGIATIVNAHGSLADLDPGGVLMLPDLFDPEHLAEALDRLAGDPDLRQRIGASGLSVIQRENAPDQCARLYAETVERFYQTSAGENRALQNFAPSPSSRDRLVDVARVLAWNLPPEPRLRQLLVDVSAIARVDLKTGVQRVVRNILTEWLKSPPRGWNVLPVYGSAQAPGYRYARRWTEPFLDLPEGDLDDVPVDVWPGDIFLALDLDAAVAVANQDVLDGWHRKGVDIRFVVYDLLPVRLSQHFPESEVPQFQRWLSTIARYGGAVCISRTVASDLTRWLRSNVAPSILPFRVDSFRLGADIEGPTSAGGMPPGGRAALQAVAASPSFLMVGTVEPRKGHAQALAAFEAIWAAGDAAACLVIVGKQGWQVEGLCTRLRGHAEAGRRLFWFESASDALLARLYGASACLLMASEGEGFGLPLIEAARAGLPILARDLPEFREIAGDHAFYFAGGAPADLANAIRDWLAQREAGAHPRSDRLPFVTWAESARELLAALGIEVRPNDGPGRDAEPS